MEAGEYDDHRPDMVGWTTEIRHMHQLEEAIVRLHRHMARNLGIPLPKAPETAYERWVREHEDEQENLLLLDIYRANPSALGGNLN